MIKDAPHQSNSSKSRLKNSVVISECLSGGGDHEESVFCSGSLFWEEEMGDLLYQEINKISNEDRVVEFYFHTCHEIFAQKAVACIQKLRRERPEKHLSIIAIIDPLR